MERDMHKSMFAILALFAFCLVSIAPLNTVAARNTVQYYDGIVVMAVGDSQNVVQTAQEISSFDFGVKEPVTAVSVSSLQGIHTVLQHTRGYLVVVGHASYYGIETNQGLVPWAIIRSFIESSPAKAIVVASCYSTMLGRFYDRAGVYGFNERVDVEVARLATCGMLLRELGNDGKAREVVDQLFQQDILKKAFYPENALDYSTIGSDWAYGSNNGWLKAYLEVRKDTSETDPSWDYYFAVLTLQDVRWQNDFFTSPYIAEATIQFTKCSSGDVISDHSPTSGVNTLANVALKVFGWSLGIPGGFTNYQESDTGYFKKAWWHQEGGWSIFGIWFIFEDKTDFAISFKVPQGSHGSVQAYGVVAWYTWAIFIFYYQGQDWSRWLYVSW